MTSFEDFDRYVEENNIAEEDIPAAFAQWLANVSGQTITAVIVSSGSP